MRPRWNFQPSIYPSIHTCSFFHQTILELLLCTRPWAQTHVLPRAAPGCVWEVVNVHVHQPHLGHGTEEPNTCPQRLQLPQFGKRLWNLHFNKYSRLFCMRGAAGNSVLAARRQNQPSCCAPPPKAKDPPQESWRCPGGSFGALVPCPERPRSSPLHPPIPLLSPYLLHALNSLKRVTCCFSFFIQTLMTCFLPHLQVCPHFFLV